MFKIEGNRIITQSDYEVIEPAVLFDRTGVFHKFGNYQDLLSVFNLWRELDKTGIISRDLVLMNFDKLTLQEVVDIVDKMMNISGYCMDFYNQLEEGVL